MLLSVGQSILLGARPAVRIPEQSGPIFWPPRRPNIIMIRDRITAAITTVIPDMIQRTWQEIDYSLDICPSDKWGIYQNILREHKNFRHFLAI
jgi:hypothetical protein